MNSETRSVLSESRFERKTTYSPTKNEIWTGRRDPDAPSYWHQILQNVDLEKQKLNPLTEGQKGFALLGYASDEGVRRNQGRVGAVAGPDAIRKVAGSLANHFDSSVSLLDTGNTNCLSRLSEIVTEVLDKNYFPILLGGGHDISYGHFCGIQNHLVSTHPDSPIIGIINLDAHFDIRTTQNGANSGTSFYQIATESNRKSLPFHYLCLGIQNQANTKSCYARANDLGVQYMPIEEFHINNLASVKQKLASFIARVDKIYLTIDLDGFSSAFAPGVSAPSPFGFAPDIATEVIRAIGQSGKLISMDLAELNPTYDLDNRTARLAAIMMHQVTCLN